MHRCQRLRQEEHFSTFWAPFCLNMKLCVDVNKVVENPSSRIGSEPSGHISSSSQTETRLASVFIRFQPGLAADAAL